MQNNDENRNVGENIRLYRIRAGMTVKELSKRIHQHHHLVIKPGSIRNYEKGTEKIPAVALNSIAAITRTDIREFHEPAHPTIMLDTSQKLHLLEAFSMIRCRASRDTLLHLARKLGKG
ncbi:MAG: helix-turn-helix domain-containing protein [Rickettsiales bacterium]